MNENSAPESASTEWAVLAQGQPGYLRELHDALTEAGHPASILDPQAVGSPNR